MTYTTLPTPSTPLRDRMIEDMKVTVFCQTTQRNYLRDVERFATAWTATRQATDEDLRRYQIEQSEMGAAPGHEHRSVSATVLLHTNA
jgi:hypothetical protein